MLRRTLGKALVATVLAAQVISAQSSTGVDGSWTVQYKPIASSTYSSATTAPVVVGPPAPPWAANTPQYAWISAVSDGSVDDVPQTGLRYDYLFSTTFSLANPSTITFACSIDNALGTLSINGGAESPGGCPLWNFGSDQTLMLGTGTNTLTFHVQGDGTTDGLVVNIKSVAVTATPEPASMTLLATGLAGIFGAARRRRKA